MPETCVEIAIEVGNLTEIGLRQCEIETELLHDILRFSDVAASKYSTPFQELTVISGEQLFSLRWRRGFTPFGFGLFHLLLKE